jgi:hypothetical protein
MRQNGVRSNVRFPTGASGMKKGGKAKKQGYKDRKDESIAMRIKKKRTKKQLRASADDSYGKFGSKAKKSGKINRLFKKIKNFICICKLLGIKQCACPEDMQVEVFTQTKPTHCGSHTRFIKSCHQCIAITT